MRLTLCFGTLMWVRRHYTMSTAILPLFAHTHTYVNMYVCNVLTFNYFIFVFMYLEFFILLLSHWTRKTKNTLPPLVCIPFIYLCKYFRFYFLLAFPQNLNKKYTILYSAYEVHFKVATKLCVLFCSLMRPRRSPGRKQM